MNLRKLALLTSGTTAIVLVSTIAALAVPAIATGAVNVRTGPNSSYNRVDTLHRGEHVNVTECNSGWCYVEHSGPNGWVSGNYLASPSTVTPSGSATPRVNFGVTWSPGSGPTFHISVGTSSPSYTPSTPAQVCFYKNNHYNGASFCVAPGTNDTHLPSSWNNKISSIQVFGGAKVQVCKNYNYSGGCIGYTSNKAVLPGSFNNKVSSYHTWM